MAIKKPLLLKFFFIATLLESAVALLFFLLIPTGTKNSALFGFSANRLVLAGFILAVVMVSLGAILFTTQLAKVLDVFLINNKNKSLLTLFGSLLCGASLLFLLMPTSNIGEAVYERLFPFLVLFILIGLQIVLVQFVWNGNRLNWLHLVQWKHSLQLTGGIIIFFILVGVFVLWTGIGIQPDPNRWSSPGTPLLPQQVLFASALGIILFFFLRKYTHYKKLDLVLGVCLWFATVLTWWLEPMRRWSYFTPKPTPPNFEYYPYSDAALYDKFAQNFLIGESRHFGITHRPLYSIFLAFLHFIGGQKFNNIIFLQILFFAITPVFVYLLVAKLGSKPAGIIAGLLILFRERNSITLTNIIEVSDLKLLMSDVPTMAMMIIFIYFFVVWLQDREKRAYLGVLAGGFFGLTVLIRSQAQLLIPIVIFGIVVSDKFSWKVFTQRFLVFVFSFLVVIAPWIIRNYVVSGRAVVEYQEIYTKQIASSYATSPGEIEILPNESQAEYDARMKKIVVDYILANPLEVAKFYTSYFIHNEILSVVTLPMTVRFFNLYQYVDVLGFWKESLGSLPGNVLPIFFVYLCVIAVGISISFCRFKWVGLMPLLFHLGYSLSVVPVRLSGWRFILPVDWVSFIYFSLGLAQIGVMLFNLLSQTSYEVTEITSPTENSFKPINWNKVGMTFLVFAILGVSFPAIEWSIPRYYPKLSNDSLIQKYALDGFMLRKDVKVSASDLKSFIETDSAAVVLYGRALYPQFYEKGKYWGDSNQNLLEASLYNRIQFDVIGPRSGFAFIPLEQPLEYFPNVSDVFAVGCRQGDATRVLFVRVNDSLIVSSDWHGLNCSMME
ncbi:MAG: glycosyltransferase family 39 protein [Anaerolineales bacterium]